jgi:hypothetical protein
MRNADLAGVKVAGGSNDPIFATETADVAGAKEDPVSNDAGFAMGNADVAGVKVASGSNDLILGMGNAGVAGVKEAADPVSTRENAVLEGLKQGLLAEAERTICFSQVSANAFWRRLPGTSISTPHAQSRCPFRMPKPMPILHAQSRCPFRMSNPDADSTCQFHMPNPDAQSA